ncbi:MAG: cation-efflux pump [Chloroflexi bacterium]|nr:cation-efflux pump [Chloroflexota bacterium]MCL5274545.1 cation-efflux pump [Chloroflexota bacterium]
MNKSKTAVVSFSISVALAVLKIALAIVSGSVSMFAEAINNTSDVLTSLVTLAAVKISDKPADENYPYGHGKIESLSALITTGFLFAIYLSVIREAIARLIAPLPIENGLLAMAAIVVGIAFNIGRVAMLTRAARVHRSQALAAEALNFRTDILSSSIVLIAIALELLSNGNPILQRADAVGAILVAGVVLLFAVRLGRQAINTLLDRASEQLTRRIRNAARQVSGVIAVDTIRAREVGAQIFVDLTASVPRSMSLEGSHDVATQIEERIRDNTGNSSGDADIIVRINPVAQENESLVDDIHAAAVRDGKAVHNISVREVGADKYVHLDLELNGRLDLQAAHDIATELERSLKEQFHLLHVSVHIEPTSEPIKARVVSQQQATIKEIKRIAGSEPRIQSVDNIVLDRVGSHINISLDCQFNANMSLADAHLAAEHLEQSLRRHLPHLGQVLIHTEPEGAVDVP